MQNMVSYDLLLFMLKIETTTGGTNSMPFLVFRRDHLRLKLIDDSCETQPEIAHGNVMCVRVLCWNIQWNNISSYCWIVAKCRALWNEIRKESYHNTTGWRITLHQGLAPKCHKGDVILTSVSIYSWLFHSCVVFLVVSAHWCDAT